MSRHRRRMHARHRRAPRRDRTRERVCRERHEQHRAACEMFVRMDLEHHYPGATIGPVTALDDGEGKWAARVTVTLPGRVESMRITIG